MKEEPEESNVYKLKLQINELEQEIQTLKNSERNKIATIKRLKLEAVQTAIEIKENNGRIKKLDQKKQIAIDQRNEAMAEKKKLEEEILNEIHSTWNNYPV